MKILNASILIAAAIAAVAQGPPTAPPPPRFMTMHGLPLTCFDKATFEEDGLQFFVCNGGIGLGGVSKTSDPSHAVFVSDPEIAQNLNMANAKRKCGGGKFGVRSDAQGTVSFLCDAREDGQEKFRPASKSDWARYRNYLNKVK